MWLDLLVKTFCFSEIFHQMNCQGSNSPSRTQKRVQTSFAWRQRDANFFTQILLNLLAGRSIKIAKLYTMPVRSSPPPVEKNSSFNSQLRLAATGLLWSLITNWVWWQGNWLQGLLVLPKQNKKQIPEARPERYRWDSRTSDAIPNGACLLLIFPSTASLESLSP